MNHLDRGIRQEGETHGDKRLRLLLTMSHGMAGCTHLAGTSRRWPIPISQVSPPPVKLMDRHALTSTKPGDGLPRLPLPPDQLPPRPFLRRIANLPHPKLPLDCDVIAPTPTTSCYHASQDALDGTVTQQRLGNDGRLQGALSRFVVV